MNGMFKFRKYIVLAFYHGSPIGGLNELKPFLSEHGEPYVYFSSSPIVALLYAVKPVPKPYSFYPYGFDENGVVVYSEYFENAFFHLYNEKKGICTNVCTWKMRKTLQILGVHILVGNR